MEFTPTKARELKNQMRCPPTPVISNLSLEGELPLLRLPMSTIYENMLKAKDIEKSDPIMKSITSSTHKKLLSPKVRPITRSKDKLYVKVKNSGLNGKRNTELSKIKKVRYQNMIGGKVIL